MKTTTTKRSLDLLRKNGGIAGIVEQTIRFPEKINGHPTGKLIPFKRDLFNCFDIVAIEPGEVGTMFVQTTTTANQSTRCAKLLEQEETLRKILGCDNRVFVHGWKKGGPRGKRKTWQCTIQQLVFSAGGSLKFLDIAEAEAAQEYEDEDSGLLPRLGEQEEMPF